MMFSDWNDILRTRLLKEPRPSCGIVVLGLEHRDKVFVAKLILRSVSGDMVFVLIGTFAIHVSRIPFVGKSGNRVNTPVNEDSELSVLVPRGNFVFLERFPIRSVRADIIHAVHFFKDGRALGVILRAGLLPSLVNQGRGFRGGRCSRRSCALPKHRRRVSYKRQQKNAGANKSANRARIRWY